MRLADALPRHFSLFQLLIVPRLSILKVEAALCSTTQAAVAAAPRNFSALVAVAPVSTSARPVQFPHTIARLPRSDPLRPRGERK
ncbi:uncharacterized protein BKA55DRAFT_584001 [Fusarium redolens]|uniref:Secreted protein n=1 Tax=Fusarium redolens TaxID=48865 RepID=A0A9P9FZT2_FUSRE|nr:uncharacterized protein BKA55DRAFT_584001 [Fusarium redolens]KAH7228598.1 hypothetical protein BKA55DRAFT_584001 [Fusarium redolens]